MVFYLPDIRNSMGAFPLLVQEVLVSVFSILTRDALLGKIGAILSDNIGLSFNPDRYCYIVYINNIFKKWS